MPEYMARKDDGTIEFVFDSKVFKFRRPLFGEYTTLVNQLHDIDDREQEAKIQALEQEPPTRKVLTKPTRAERLAEERWLFDRNRNVRERNAKMRFELVEWIMAAYGMLSSGKPEWPSHDDLPAWLEASAETYSSRIAEHWRKVPLAPGEKSDPTLAE